MRRISTGDKSFTLRVPVDVDRTEVSPMRAIDLLMKGDSFVETGSEPQPDGYRCGGTTILTVRGFQSADAARLGFERILHAFANMHADRLRRAYIRPILDDAGQEVFFPDENGKPVRARMFSAIIPILYNESDHIVLDGAFSIDFARTTDFEFVERINRAPVGALRYPTHAKLVAACGMAAAASIAAPGVNLVLLTTVLEMLPDSPKVKGKTYQRLATYLKPAVRELRAESAAHCAIATHGLYEVVEAIHTVRNSYTHEGVWIAAKEGVKGMLPHDVLVIAFELVRAALLLELQALGDAQQVAQA